MEVKEVMWEGAPLPGEANDTYSGRFLFPGDESLEIPNGEFLEIPSPKGEGWNVIYAGGVVASAYKPSVLKEVLVLSFPYASSVFYFNMNKFKGGHSLFFDHKEAREIIEKNLDRLKSEKLVCHWWVQWQRNGGWKRSVE